MTVEHVLPELRVRNTGANKGRKAQRIPSMNTQCRSRLMYSDVVCGGLLSLGPKLPPCARPAGWCRMFSSGVATWISVLMTPVCFGGACVGSTSVAQRARTCPRQGPRPTKVVRGFAFGAVLFGSVCRVALSGERMRGTRGSPYKTPGPVGWKPRGRTEEHADPQGGLASLGMLCGGASDSGPRAIAPGRVRRQAPPQSIPRYGPVWAAPKKQPNTGQAVAGQPRGAIPVTWQAWSNRNAGVGQKPQVLSLQLETYPLLYPTWGRGWVCVETLVYEVRQARQRDCREA